jgi:CubicO group peptidase (beta-lactamase class C family)
MKKVYHIFIEFCLISLFFFASYSQAISTTNIQSNYDFTPIDNLLEEKLTSIPIDGCVLLLIKDEKIIYEKAFGSYSLNTVVPIASATKWVSAVLILDLVDDGLLSLDDKVSEYIPSFLNRGDKKDITIRQCFSHSSGLPRTAFVLNYQQPPWTLETCVEYIANKDLEEPPGSAFRYGGCSMQVAGRVAEIVGGDSWINLYNDRIADPLEIESLVWNNDYPDTLNPRIAGGIHQITVHDYAKLIQMLANGGSLNGVTIMSSETADEMFIDQTYGAPVVYSPYDGRIDFPHLGYSIGAWIDTTNQQDEVVELSSTGAWGFHPWIDRQRNIIGVFLVESTLNKIYETEVKLRMLVREITAVNQAANIPNKPDGPTGGKTGLEYTYTALSTDPESEDVSYLYDWGDGSRNSWSEYVPSGTAIEMSHTWSKSGNYDIRVKAKDSHGTESRWSNPLAITMPIDKAFQNSIIFKLFDLFPNAFPILRQILKIQ